MPDFKDLNQQQVQSDGAFNQNVISSANSDLEVNQKNQEAYDQLVDKSKTNLDSYYDKNNIFVKLVKLILAIFIIGGFAYYFLMWLSIK